MAARGVGLAAYVLVMIVAVRPLLAGLVARSPSRADRWRMLAPILLVVLTSAAVTDALGVHALFGAFFAGLMMPRADSAAGLEEVIEPLTMTILLPLFFAFTGLRTDVHLLGAAHLLSVTAWILVLAVLSKGGASALAGRLAGLDWRDAFALGALLNTRGLIELVILNIGLDAGILSPVVFSMFVLMTIVTTCMTSPLVVWLYRPSVSSPQYR